MRRFVLAVLTLVCSAGLAAAQSGTLNLNTSRTDVAHPLAAAKDGPMFTVDNGDAVATPLAPIDLMAQPAAAPLPTPTPIFGHYEGYRFQLSESYAYFRFRSTPFNANLHGLQSSLSYFLNDWFAVEGNVVATFGSRAFGDRSKGLLYTGGGRLAWRGNRRPYEPWMHALIGGLHMIPQTALGGKNGFAVQAGGGVDYRLGGRASVRVGGDFVHSQLYSQSQNNFQITGGLVLNF